MKKDFNLGLKVSNHTQTGRVGHGNSSVFAVRNVQQITFSIVSWEKTL